MTFPLGFSRCKNANINRHEISLFFVFFQKKSHKKWWGSIMFSDEEGSCFSSFEKMCRVFAEFCVNLRPDKIGRHDNTRFLLFSFHLWKKAAWWSCRGNQRENVRICTKKRPAVARARHIRRHRQRTVRRAAAPRVPQSRHTAYRAFHNHWD